MNNRIIRFKALAPLLVAGLFFVGIAAGSTELEGNWRTIRHDGVEAAYLSFGADRSFFIDGASNWYSGSFKLEADDEPSHLILDVEDGSEIERIGKQFVFLYELDEETLTVDVSQSSGILEHQGPNARSVYVAINYDSDEDDDDEEFSLYASCFIETSLPNGIVDFSLDSK